MNRFNKTFVLVFASYFLLNGFLPRENEALTAKTAFYINEGYSQEAAEHIAKVDLKIIKADQFYNDLIND